MSTTETKCPIRLIKQSVQTKTTYRTAALVLDAFRKLERETVRGLAEERAEVERKARQRW